MDALTFDNFGFTYPKMPHSVLDHIGWHIPEGSFALLGGATGIGKTTLLRCAHPILAPSGTMAGHIKVFGEDIASPDQKWDAHRCAQTIAYVSQSPETQIVCDTVWHELAFGLENLGIPQEAIRRRVAEIAHFFGIESWFHRTTDELSGGQKQLLNLASVLVMQPRILVLDEPTAQLDPVASKNFLHALFRINRELGIVVVVATHEPYEMRAYATDEYVLQPSGIERVEIHRQVDSQFAPVAYASTNPHVHPLTGHSTAHPDASSFSTDRSNLTEEHADSSASASPLSATSSSKTNTLSCKNVWFRYDRSLPWVLKGFDLSIEQGTCHAIVGGNGCGKSTLLQLFAGTLKSERGHVCNAAHDCQAFLPQNPKTLFLSDTVSEELHAWQKDAGYSDDDVEQWMQRLAIQDIKDQHPYDTSGGQQQKIALAKLLLTQPSLLLLDEPTKGLDAPTRRQLAQVLTTCRNNGMTIVLATHDLAFAELIATQVTMVFDGEATATEPPATFFADSIFFRPSAAEREALNGCK